VSRFAASLVGALILAILAAGLAEATLAMGQRGSLTDGTGGRPQASATPTPRPAVSPKSSPTSKASPTPVSTPIPTPSASPLPTATTNAFVHLRAQASTSSQILANLNGGAVVKLLPESNSQWQEVEWNGITGFIFISYLDY
jgi:hypothetical protein